VSDQLQTVAEQVGGYWKTADAYYDGAESEMDQRWEHVLWPYVKDFEFTVCVDLAAGHGRNTRKLLEQAGCQKVYAIDINIENVEFCRKRFVSEPRVEVVSTNGFSIPEIANGSITCFYCFDAMVHFDSDVVRQYLTEVRRVLAPGTGRAFLHHSNITKFVGRPLYGNPDNRGSRNFMSMELFAHYALKEGLALTRSQSTGCTMVSSSTDSRS
jgi:ubiquinone/menaquinone biosynthesis C-methylase UbiE